MYETLVKPRVGDAIHLQPADRAGGRRHAVRLIGYLPGESLIVTSPRVRGKVALLRDGQRFIARSLTQDTVYGYETRVLKSCASPFPYVHLSYPDEVQSIQVRQSQRVGVDIVCEVRNDTALDRPDTVYNARIDDLSVAGARLVSASPIADPLDLLTVTFEVTVAGRVETLCLPTLVRSAHPLEPAGPADGAQRYGVEFRFSDPAQGVTLHGFVYERLARETVA